jgi:hypothetical protein
VKLPEIERLDCQILEAPFDPALQVRMAVACYALLRKPLVHGGIERTADGIMMRREILSHGAFTSYIAREHLPGSAVHTRAELATSPGGRAHRLSSGRELPRG